MKANGAAKILLVDDEDDILEFLTYNLEKENYEIATASNGFDAIRVAASFLPDIIVLDIMMPGMDGIEVCANLRENKDLSNTLIVFLTARDESFTEVSALDTGGDDFITKPIKPSVFKSRIKALLRRRGLNDSENSGTELVFGDLIINTEQFSVHLRDKPITLAKKEFELLKLLTSKPGKVFKRKEILDRIWGVDVIVGDRTIDVHIRKIREKLGDGYIKTLKGVGYKFDFDAF